MRVVRKVIGSWWFLSVLTAAVLVLLLVVLLPQFFTDLRPLSVRILLFLLIAGIWAGLAVWRIVSARRASDRLANSLERRVDETSGEAQVLAERMREALAGLRAGSRRRDYLYSRPWYVIIGASAAGKTTALMNSGLNFPKTDQSWQSAGGTRNIKFLFSEEAVLIDTAGRYTTQDSDSSRDRAAWAQFLSLLKRNRPLQPINGVIVALSLEDVAAADADEIERHAGIVKQRVQELQVALDVTVPIYVLLTKADLIAGFVEFFGDLTAEGRRAVLGATRAGKPSLTAPAADFVEPFDELARAVNARTAERLQKEEDAGRRSLIVGFPAQIIDLRARLLAFMKQAFAEDGGPALLRGFYFTSGIQEGTPFDRILGRRSSAAASPAPAQAKGRAYFINRLLLDVVIPEAGLVRRSAALRLRERRIVWGGFGLVAAVSLLMLAVWSNSYLLNRTFQDDLQAKAIAAGNQIKASGFNLLEVGDTPDLAQAVPILDKLRDLPGGYAEQTGAGHSLAMGFGLYQTGLGERARLAYTDALQRIMLPRLLLALERRLPELRTKNIPLYQAFKVYLMLGGQHLDKKTVEQWEDADWSSRHQELSADLALHLDAMLSDPGSGTAWGDGPPPLDGDLIKTSRAALDAMKLPERAYALVLQRGLSIQGKDWQPPINDGDALAFADGAAVRALAVPYFFTPDGFNLVFRPSLLRVQLDLQNDSWMFAGEPSGPSGTAGYNQIQDVVSRDYARDYIAAWETVTGALRPADYFSSTLALNAATGDPSAVKTVLTEVVNNTTLGVAEKALKDAAAARAARAMPVEIVRGMAAMNAGADPSTTDAATIIGGHFAELREYLAKKYLDHFLENLRNAAAARAESDNAGVGVDAAGSRQAFNHAVTAMAIEAAPPPQLQAFLNGTTKQGQAAGVTAAQSNLQASYTATVYPLCSQLASQYPFLGASTQDAALADMSNVFAPDQTVDGFVKGNLVLLLEKAAIWRWLPNQTVTQAFNPATPTQFQKAAGIRDLLAFGLRDVHIEATGFGDGVTAADFSAGSYPPLHFDATTHGPQSFLWSTQSQPEAHVTLYAGTTVLKTIPFPGTWAIFRLFDSVKAVPAGANAFEVKFGDGTAYVKFRVTYPLGTMNPFGRGGLWSYRCTPQL